MNPPILHIIKQGAREQIPFIIQHNALINTKPDPRFRQSFIASGEFGTVCYEQFQLDGTVLQNIDLKIREEVEISFRTVSENISLIYSSVGSIFFRTDEFPSALIAQTQAKTIYSQNAINFFLNINGRENKQFSLTNICIPVSTGIVDNKAAGHEIKKYIQRLDNSSGKVSTFISTADFQKEFLAMQEELGKKDPDLHLVQSYIDILLLETVLHHELSRHDENGHEHWDPEIKAVYAMAEMIIMGMDESWTIKKFASAQHLNPNKLKILFKKHIGMPAAAFRISVRMQKARQLLLETKLSIQEISALVGYTNPAQFSTMFKRKIGYPPNRVRKE